MEIKIKHFNKDYDSTLILGFIIGIFLLPVLNNFAKGPEVLYTNLILILGMPLFCLSVFFFCTLVFAKQRDLLQFTKFGLIGVANTAINVGVFNYFINATGLTVGLPLVIISTVSFLAALINSYIWNTHWAFHGGFNNTLLQFEKFFLISFCGLLVNDTVIIILTTLLKSSWEPKLAANLANIAGIIISMFWNYFGYRLVVFKKRK
jgi:putative flippase GtrA